MSCSWGRHVGGVISWGCNDRKSKGKFVLVRKWQENVLNHTTRKKLIMFRLKGHMIAPIG